VLGVQTEALYVANDEAVHPATRLVAEPPLDACHGNARLYRLAKIVVAPRSELPDPTLDEPRQVAVVDAESSDVAMQRRVRTAAGGQPCPTTSLQMILTRSKAMPGSTTAGSRIWTSSRADS
jgi:hypothetical protein